MSDREQHERVAERIQDAEGVKTALKRAARAALRRRQAAGGMVPVWREGRVVRVAPEELLGEAGETRPVGEV